MNNQVKLNQENCKKAIETIKKNYPPENYTMLREALEIAIMSLQVHSNTPPVPTINTVNNRLDKDIFISFLNTELSHWNSSDTYARGRADGVQWVIDRVKSVPSVPTIKQGDTEAFARINATYYAEHQLFLNQRRELAETQAREQKLREAIEFVFINHMLYWSGDAYEHLKETLDSLYPKEEEA